MLWLWNRDSIPPMINDPTIDTVVTWLATTPTRASGAENGIRKRLKRGFRNVSDVAARKPAQRRLAATTRCGPVMVCGVMDRVFTLSEIFKWVSVVKAAGARTSTGRRVVTDHEYEYRLRERWVDEPSEHAGPGIEQHADRRADDLGCEHARRDAGLYQSRIAIQVNECR
jgi:hypothetical protein